MNAVAIMMTKNEVLIIDETLKQYEEANIPVIVMDDSDDGTDEIIKLFPNTTLLKQGDIYGRDVRGSGDWFLAGEEGARVSP